LQQVAAMLEMESLLSRSAAGLSGGERQRVAIARALVRPARVVLLDEPFTNFDVTLRRRIRTRLREDFRRRQTAVLMVTHDRTDIDAMADRLAVMRDGQVEQVGTVKELRETPRNGFVREWLEALYCEPGFGNN
jgi:multiple sugar transport system ATP-binding protein